MLDNKLDNTLSAYDPEALREELAARESQAAEKQLAGDKRAGVRSLAMQSLARVPDPDLQEYSTEKIAEALRMVQKVVYDMDDRQDMFDVKDWPLLTDASSVVSLVNVASVKDNGEWNVYPEGADLWGASEPL